MMLTPLTANNVTKTKRVIVIGAGMSGLACARELQERRYDVLVLEARNRVGGRVWGAPLAVPDKGEFSLTEVDIDLGGAIIHGAIRNPLSQICVQLRIATSDNLRDCLLLDSEGWPIDAKEDEKMSQLFNKALEETFRKVEEDKKSPKSNLSKRRKTLHSLEKSVKSDEKKKKHEETAGKNFGDLFHKVSSQLYGNAVIESPLWNWYRANLELSCGTSFDELGYSWNDDEAYGFEGAHVSLCKSWKKVVEELAEPLNIVYDCPVTGIEILENGDESKLINKISEEKGRSSIGRAQNGRRIKQTDGKENCSRKSRRISKSPKYFIDDSYLYEMKNNQQKHFDAKLPAKALVRLQDGSVLQADSVVCTLPLGVLKTTSIQFVPSLPPDKQKAISNLGCGLLNKCALSFKEVFWQNSDFLGMAGKHSPFLILNGHKITGKPVLIFMFGGSSAHDVDKYWNDHDLVVECMAVLRKVSKLAPPSPIDYIITRWGQDSHAKMSFSYVPPNIDGTEAYLKLSEPLLSADGKPVVLFAGEHTTAYHPSTIHGAYLSGIREAYRLDLALEPRLNRDLSFNTSSLYQRTFVLKEVENGEMPSKVVMDGAAGRKTDEDLDPQSTVSGPKPSKGRSRGAMGLRKKKSTNTTNPTVISDLAHSHLMEIKPVRKSARKIRVPKTYEIEGYDEVEENDVSQQPCESQQQETNKKQYDRTMNRIVQAYQNWEIVKTKVLPLYGIGHKKLDALKRNYLSLRRKVRRHDTKSLLINWKVGEVSKLKDCIKHNPSVTGSRKSERKVTPRTMIDL